MENLFPWTPAELLYAFIVLSSSLAYVIRAWINGRY